MTDSFVYCWTDHKENMLYVGVHRGSQHDGYICSSKVMKEAYVDHPNFFTRTIIASGNWKDMVTLETAILNSAGAAKSNFFYNRHNNNGQYRNPKHSPITREKISKSNKGKPKLKARGPRPHTTGERNHFYCKTHNENTRKIMSEKAKLRSKGASNNNAKKIEIDGVCYGTMKDASTDLKMSMYYIRSMIKTGIAKEL